MKKEIEHFEPLSPSVVATGDRRVRAWVGDARPYVGGTLWVGDTPTRVVTLAGACRVEAVLFGTDGVRVGDEVRWDPQDASWPAPREGSTLVSSLNFEPGRSKRERTDQQSITAGKLGIDVVDQLLPFAEHGVTILLDSGAPDQCFDRVLAHCTPLVCAAIRPVARATHQILGEGGLAVAVAVQWAREIPGSTLYIEAPPFDVDAITAQLGGITVVVRVLLEGGLEVLAETLDLGRSDTEIFLREDGTVDLTRSRSRIRKDQAWGTRLSRLPALREQLAIFGDDELEQTDLELLREIEELERGLVR